MQVNKYKITLAHDNGTFTVITTATTEDAAVNQVLAAEHAPTSAVRTTEWLGPVVVDAAPVIDPVLVRLAYRIMWNYHGGNIEDGAAALRQLGVDSAIIDRALADARGNLRRLFRSTMDKLGHTD